MCHTTALKSSISMMTMVSTWLKSWRCCVINIWTHRFKKVTTRLSLTQELLWHSSSNSSQSLESKKTGPHSLLVLKVSTRKGEEIERSLLRKCISQVHLLTNQHQVWDHLIFQMMKINLYKWRLLHKTHLKLSLQSFWPVRSKRLIRIENTL